MPEKKYLVEFLAEWIRNPEFRCEVLFDEMQGIVDFGVDEDTRDALLSLETSKIIERLLEELQQELNIRPDDVLEEISGLGLIGGGGGFTGALWNRDHTHVRGVEPGKISKDVESLVRVRGHGWKPDVEVYFEEPGGTGTIVPGEVLDVDCDIDIYQRALVKVTLPTVGDWLVRARVPANSTPESEEHVVLEVE